MSEELMKRARNYDSLNDGLSGKNQADVKLVNDLADHIETLENTVKMVENPHLVLQLSNRVSELEYLVQVIYDTGQIRELPTTVVTTWDSCVSEYAFKHKKLNGA